MDFLSLISHSADVVALEDRESDDNKMELDAGAMWLAG